MAPFEIRTLPSQPTMSIRGWITVPEISSAIGARLPAVWQYVESAGGRVAGPPFTRYHVIDGDRIDFEAGLPVVSALSPSGPIAPATLPGGEAAVAVHIGPYEGLPATGQRLAAWIAEQGRVAAGPNWESYVTDPGMEHDPANWRTEILTPLWPPA